MSRIVEINWNSTNAQKLATVLTVAGSDSSGGAGIEADVKAITANGAYALTAITALTAQNTLGVEGIQPTEKDFLSKIFHANFSDISVDAIKTGLLTIDAIDLLSEYLVRYGRGKALVIDPVLVATTGAELSAQETLMHSINKLIRHATIVTPNLIEAQTILKLVDENADINSLDDLQQAARKIHERTGVVNVLIKGGHIPWNSIGERAAVGSESYLTDVLYCSLDGSFSTFKSGFVSTENTHGTGCTLASTIATKLAQGFEIKSAVESSIRYVRGAIISSSKIGHGNGPLNHVYHIVTTPITTNILDKPLFQNGHFVEFLISHPTVQPIWSQYVNHPFVSQLASGALPLSNFIYFLKQDYAYLISYARVHALAASVAPDIECIERESYILKEISHETSLHVNKLRRHGVTDLSSVTKSVAGEEYAQYLFNIAKTGDWIDINVALAPCLFGYREASANVAITTENLEYQEWINDYRSEEYINATIYGKQTIEKHSVDIDLEKTLRLVKIFSDVTLLEVNFWNDALSNQK